MEMFDIENYHHTIKCMLLFVFQFFILNEKENKEKNYVKIYF